MNKTELAEFKQNPDGTYHFRLLFKALPSIKIENTQISITDIVFGIIENPTGGISEMPEAQVIFEIGGEKLSKSISPPESIELKGWNLKFLYAFSGEIPKLSVQTAVHFLLTPPNRKG
jgi:hypothetical protein